MFSIFKPKAECPRCLGKGHVDMGDITRLGKELKWLPGPCAYCGGKGKVKAQMISRVNPGITYLTTDLEKDERQRLLNGEEEVLERAAYNDSQYDVFIKQIEYLYYMGRMDAETITDFYLISRYAEEVPVEEKLEFIEYVEKVIEKSREDRFGTR